MCCTALWTTTPCGNDSKYQVKQGRNSARHAEYVFNLSTDSCKDQDSLDPEILPWVARSLFWILASSCPLTANQQQNKLGINKVNMQGRVEDLHSYFSTEDYDIWRWRETFRTSLLCVLPHCHLAFWGRAIANIISNTCFFWYDTSKCLRWKRPTATTEQVVLVTLGIFNRPGCTLCTKHFVHSQVVLYVVRLLISTN